MNLIVEQNISDSMLDFLKQDFSEVYASLHLNDLTEAHFDILAKAYSGDNRYYHNLSHIYNFIKLTDNHKHSINHKALFKIAIWFHDAVYEAKNKDNERQSQQLFQTLLKANLSDVQNDYVHDLIMSTEGHAPRNDQSDTLFFLDFDLAILAADYAVYEAYASAVWNEYKGTYPKLMYKMGRKKVLNSFLTKENIFYTDHFKNNYESVARQNVSLELNS